MPPVYTAPVGVGGQLGGQDSNLRHPAPKAGVLPTELPPKNGCHVRRRPWFAVLARFRIAAGAAARLARLMGSLIKKRRKRMRKKKHKKMLRRTRHQRQRGK